MTDDRDGDREVLLAGTNERNLELLAEFLEDRGFPARVETDAEGLAAACDDAPFALAIVDMDGFGPDVWTTCGRLRDSGTPLVALALDPGKVRDASAGRGGPVLEKPIQKRDLIETIRRTVD